MALLGHGWDPNLQFLGRLRAVVSSGIEDFTGLAHVLKPYRNLLGYAGLLHCDAVQRATTGHRFFTVCDHNKLGPLQEFI